MKIKTLRGMDTENIHIFKYDHMQKLSFGICCNKCQHLAPNNAESK